MKHLNLTAITTVSTPYIGDALVEPGNSLAGAKFR